MNAQYRVNNIIVTIGSYIKMDPKTQWNMLYLVFKIRTTFIRIFHPDTSNLNQYLTIIFLQCIKGIQEKQLREKIST